MHCSGGRPQPPAEARLRALLFAACLRQVALLAFTERLHCPQVATHMAFLHADLSHRTNNSGDWTAVRMGAGQMNRHLRGDKAPGNQQAGHHLQPPPGFAGNDKRSEWQVHQELDGFWDQHSEASPQVTSQGAVADHLKRV